MTTALILLTVILVILVVASAVSLWRMLTGASQPGTSPRHVEDDWATGRLPSRPYHQVPRLP